MPCARHRPSPRARAAFQYAFGFLIGAALSAGLIDAGIQGASPGRLAPVPYPSRSGG